MTNAFKTNMPVDLSEIVPAILPGADWAWNFYVKDDSGVVQDLTGCSALLQIRDEVNGELKKQLTSAGSAGITITAGLGKVAIKYAGADTALLDVRRVVWDILFTDAGSNKTFPFKGTTLVHDVVTK